MTVDGAVFDRPQIGPAYDDRPGRPYDRVMREFYEQEHWLPIAHSGGADVAFDRAQLVFAVRAGLEAPGEKTDARRQLVSEVITYPDGNSTGRVAREVAEFLGSVTTHEEERVR
jgi:hypothetical protein